LTSSTTKRTHVHKGWCELKRDMVHCIVLLLEKGAGKEHRPTTVNIASAIEFKIINGDRRSWVIRCLSLKNVSTVRPNFVQLPRRRIKGYATLL
jgi:hypothetical protein